MFCKYCGKSLNEGSLFCKYCGKQLSKKTDVKSSVNKSNQFNMNNKENLDYVKKFIQVLDLNGWDCNLPAEHYTAMLQQMSKYTSIQLNNEEDYIRMAMFIIQDEEVLEGLRDICGISERI